MTKIVAQNVVRIRNTQGRSQAEFAEFCKIPLRTLQNIEGGNRVPRSATLQKITSKLEISESELYLDPDLNTQSGSILRELLARLSALNDTQLRMLLEAAKAFSPSSIQVGADRNKKKES